MRIKENTKAIDFSTSDYKNQPVILSEYTGRKILLSFFRDAACPFCNLRVHQLIKNYDKLEVQNFKVITFFAATKEEIYNYAGQQRAPFPIIADPDLEWYKKYGVESSQMGMIRAMLKPLLMMKVMTSGFFNLKSATKKPLIPADFLIDENQMIVKAHYGKDYGDHLDLKEIQRWIEPG